jgi:predicted Zn finger-like uncharacterized protein
MQLACPTCHTAFHIEPGTLGDNGRSVRCTRCRTVWLARSADLLPDPVMAEASAGEGSTLPTISGGGLLPQVVPWNDTVMVEVESSPPVAPVAARPAIAERDWSPAARRAAARKSRTRSRLVAATIVLAALVVGALGSRASIVRAVPDLAGFYAAIGLPVNLRGLEFRSVRTTKEIHDGTPVLIIEGEIANVTRGTADVPRLRFAVNGVGDKELYAWTALLPRATLPGGESVTFRSRLASPPSDGEEVVVRFLNRLDLSSNGR